MGMVCLALLPRVEPSPEPRPVAGGDGDRCITKPLFQFLGQFRIGCAKDDLRAEIVEHIRSAVLPVDGPNLRFVLNHERQRDPVCPKELCALCQCIRPTKTGKFVQHEQRRHLQAWVLLRRCVGVGIEGLIPEQPQQWAQPRCRGDLCGDSGGFWRGLLRWRLLVPGIGGKITGRQRLPV